VAFSFLLYHRCVKPLMPDFDVSFAFRQSFPQVVLGRAKLVVLRVTDILLVLLQARVIHGIGTCVIAALVSRQESILTEV
jgi:hypothetical protein